MDCEFYYNAKENFGYPIYLHDVLVTNRVHSGQISSKYNESFNYHFRDDCVRIANDFQSRNIRFDDGFRVHMGQHPRMLRLLIQRKVNFQTAIYLNKHLSFIKDWDKNISEKVVWPKISYTITKLKPFVTFNETECKMIMKDVFVK